MCMAMKGANFEKPTVLYRGNKDRESEYMPSVLVKGTLGPYRVPAKPGLVVNLPCCRQLSSEILHTYEGLTRPMSVV